jgi:hypothetical protein
VEEDVYPYCRTSLLWLSFIQMNTYVKHPDQDVT